MKRLRSTTIGLVLTILAVLSVLPGTAQIWNLSADYSLTNNPEGAWTFGWQDRGEDRLNPYDLLWGTQADSPIKGFFSPGWFGPVRAWCKTRADAQQMAAALPVPGELPYPDHWVEANFAGAEVVRQAAGLPSYPDPFGYVSKNMAPGPFGAWGYYWEPGMVLLMPPGNRGKDARTVVRWTSPVSGKVIVQARFTGQRIQGDAGMQSQVNVSHNSKAQFEGMIDGFRGRTDLAFEDAMGNRSSQTWRGILSVDRGDILDFTAGTVPGFNFGIFGIVNKQMLPGVALEASIAVLPDENVIAREWVSAKFGGTPAAARIASPTDFGEASSQPPFSFKYGDKASTELLKDWPLERSSRQLDRDRTEHTLRWKDPATGLEVRCVGIEYERFPTIEWTLYFKNTGTTDTPLVGNIQALEFPITRGEGSEFVLRRIVDAAIATTELKPETVRRVVDPIPYFNLELPGQGVIVAVSWSGQAAVEFKRSATNDLLVRAGQDLTRFKLHPGEEVRSPMVVLQFWSGDRDHAHNVWRRWMIAHNMPRPGGKQLTPQHSGSSAYWHGNMVNATEENQKEFIRRYIEADLKPDFWWMDAGWYPPNISKNGTQLWALTGTWEPDKKRFPNGLRAITDYAHENGIKSIVWFQPERVSVETWLYVNHPEWLLGPDGGDKLFDFGNPHAWEWAANHFSKFVVDQGVDIYRQDMNIGPVGFWRAHDAPDRQGISEIYHVTGYLAYLDELVKRNPSLRLDHFRIDLETLRRAAPLILGIDFEPVGDQCHNYRLNQWLPWHGLCSRAIEPYGFRSLMCTAVATGWDLRRKDLDYPLARRLIQEWRQIAPNYFGDFYPLTPYSFEHSTWMAWQFDRPELGKGIIQAFRRRDSVEETRNLKLRGLEANTSYTLADFDGNKPRVMSGRELMEKGLEVRMVQQPGAALISYERSSIPSRADSGR